MGGKAGDEDDTPWNYVKANEVSETQIEDTETYEMLLKKEAEDENEVDENGKLIKKNQESTRKCPTNLRSKEL